MHVRADQEPGWLDQAIASLRYIVGRYGLAPESIPRTDTWQRLRADLAGRNLGLVPVEHAPEFHWPGYWLAGLVDGSRISAAVMFGSPSTAVWPPTARGSVEFGFVLSPFDPSLPLLTPYGSPPGKTHHGAVVGLCVAEGAGAPMRPLTEADLHAGRGIAGDRYATQEGTFSGPTGHEVTLVEGEVEDIPGLDGLTISDLRRNIVTRGIDLNQLVGQTFRVGSAILVGRRLCEPCRHLEDVVGAPLITPLVHRAGLRADIVAGGRVRIGDRVRVHASNSSSATITGGP